MEYVLLVFVGIGLTVLSVMQFIRARRINSDTKPRLQNEVDLAFLRATRTRLPQEPRYEASRMALIRTIDEFGTAEGIVTGLQSTRLYRASPDEYVLFICNAGQPGYIKLLSRIEAARHVRTTPEIHAKEFPELASRSKNEA